jgi:adenylate cyclase class 2
MGAVFFARTESANRESARLTFLQAVRILVCMTEIEIKAHVADPDETEKKISAFAHYEGRVFKSDMYWKKNGSAEAGDDIADSGAVGQTAATLPIKVRIREEREPESGVGTTVVTYKRKELQGDIEVNDEREFTIDDRAAFETLIGDLGFVPYIRKEKDTKSFSWTAPDGCKVTIELSLVAGLGWFVELEILADNPSPDETSRAQRVLRETLGRCGIPESAIERRYYTDMLAESASASGADGAADAMPRSHLPKQ